MASALAAYLLAQVHFFQLVQLKALDAQFVLRGRLPTSRIVLVTIDQKSMDTLPELRLFWHRYFAEAIRAAADGGAKVAALDVTFAIPVTKWEPDNDRILAEAVSTTAPVMPVVCAYVPSILDRQKDWPVPLNIIASALGLAAFANLTVDPDDFVRSQELIEAPAPGNDVPLARSMALRVAEKYLGSDAQLENGRLMLAGKPIPITPQRTIRINYAGPPGAYPRVSLSDFLETAHSGRQDEIRKWVEGKAVLIGPDDLEDRHATPFYTFFAGPRWNTAGVEIMAHALETLLDRRFLVPAPRFVRISLLLAFSILTVVITASLPVTPAILWFVALLVAGGISTHLLFRFGLLVPTVEIALGCFLALVAASIYRFLTAEKRGALFHNAIALFVGKQLARSLDAGEEISLSGSSQFVTILFSDIRGFTAFCEQKDPAMVVKLLNKYLADMVSIIVSHQGHVNKFIGDGILAVFSDVDGATQGDHPSRAVRCGQKMVSLPGQFRTGVGINSGPVVVGNVGSPDKMEYTVLGDTVNEASRLESLNKELKTQMVIGEATNVLLEEGIETVCLGAIPIRGKAEAMSVYTLASLAPDRTGAAAQVAKS